MASKCKCGKENWMGCPNCSKYKMVVMLAPEHANLKLEKPNGDRVNPVFYSPVKENFKSPEVVFNGMIKRFSNGKQNSYTKYFSYTRTLYLYNNPSAGNENPILESNRT